MKAIPSNIINLSLWHILYVCENMRADEIEQYLALGGQAPFNPEVMACGIFMKNGPKFTLLGRDGKPAICGGYEQIGESLWNSWMIGTQAGWDGNWRSITKASKWMIESLFGAGAVRLETKCLAGREKANRWHEKSLGMSLDGIRKKAGANGEDVHMYSLLKEDFYGHG